MSAAENASVGAVGEPSRERLTVPCRHCGDPIVPAELVPGDWNHVHHLYRCQKPGRRYGYEARPMTPEHCVCWACEKFGQTSPAVVAGVLGEPGEAGES